MRRDVAVHLAVCSLVAVLVGATGITASAGATGAAGHRPDTSTFTTDNPSAQTGSNPCPNRHTDPPFKATGSPIKGYAYLNCDFNTGGNLWVELSISRCRLLGSKGVGDILRRPPKRPPLPCTLGQLLRSGDANL